MKRRVNRMEKLQIKNSRKNIIPRSSREHYQTIARRSKAELLKNFSSVEKEIEDMKNLINSEKKKRN